MITKDLIIQMYEEEKLTFEEIAKALEVPPKFVEDDYYKAKGTGLDNHQSETGN